MCMHVCVPSFFSREKRATAPSQAHRAPLSIGFSCPHPGDLPDTGTEPMTLTSLAVPSGKPFDVCVCVCVCVCMLVAQLYPTLCNRMDYSTPGSSIHGILQARILERVAISFSRGSSQTRDWTWVSCISGRLFTIWVTREAPFYVYMHTNKGFSAQSSSHFYSCFYRSIIYIQKNAHVLRVQFDEFS